MKFGECRERLRLWAPSPQNEFNGSGVTLRDVRVSPKPDETGRVRRTELNQIATADGEKPGIRRATAALSCPARKFRESLPPPLDSGHQTRISVCDPAQALERGSTISEMF